MSCYCQSGWQKNNNNDNNNDKNNNNRNNNKNQQINQNKFLCRFIFTFSIYWHPHSVQSKNVNG